MRVYLDFEFNDTAEKDLNVICMAWKRESKTGVLSESRSIELFSRDDKEGAYKKVRALIYKWKDLAKKEDECLYLCAYNVEAEASALLSLGINPRGFIWIDLYLEYRMLLNQNDKYAYGKQLDPKTGKVTRRRKKSKWDAPASESGIDGSKGSYSLSAACFKMLDVKIDTHEKTLMRELIISKDSKLIRQNIKRILEYCESDVEYLPRLYKSILSACFQSGISRHRHLGKMTRRAKFSALTAIMVRRGYPVDVNAMKIFTANIEPMLTELKKDINKKTRKELGFDMFKFRPPVTRGKRTFTYPNEQGKRNSKQMKEWVSKKYPDWPLEPKTGLPSLAEEHVSRHSGARHDYSKDPIDQLFRFLRTNSSLNGFSSGGKGTIWDSVGSDGRCRPYMNIFGAQTSRSQPSSTSFIPLKSSWMRVLIHPEKGKKIVGLDYCQQEFLIAALWSEDEAMIDAYLSGDPYLAFAKDSGQCPKSATRETHGKVRDFAKPSVLGMLFEMGARSLAARVAKAADIVFTERQGAEQIDLFKETYSDLTRKKRETLREYENDGMLQLKDGWTMFGDQENWRSVVNFPIQGAGGAIMREAVKLCEEKGVPIIFTLHDALYAELDHDDDRSIRTMAWCMIEAFKKIMGDASDLDVKYFRKPALVNIDGAVWGPDVPLGTYEFDIEFGKKKMTIPLKTMPKYIDPRSKDDYDKFRRYMTIDSIF